MSHQFISVTKSCLTLCDPVDCSRPGFPVHHQLLELAHTYVHRVGDAVQPSHPLSYPPPEDLPDPGTEPVYLMSPALVGELLTV